MEKHLGISNPPEQSANLKDVMGKELAPFLVPAAVTQVKMPKHSPIAKDSCNKELVEFVAGIFGVRAQGILHLFFPLQLAQCLYHMLTPSLLLVLTLRSSSNRRASVRGEVCKTA